MDHNDRKVNIKNKPISAEEKVFRAYLGKRFKQVRLERGLTQGAMAEQLPINRATLSKIELGNTHCDIQTVYAMAKVTHLSLDYFVPDEATSAQGATVTQGSMREALDMIARGKVLISKGQRSIEFMLDIMNGVEPLNSVRAEDRSNSDH